MPRLARWRLGSGILAMDSSVSAGQYPEVDGFISAVSDHFGLGGVDGTRVAEMPGSANRLWRFDTPLGRFVVKELSHDAPKDLDRRRRAAAFEQAVFDRREILLAEPVVGADGEIVSLLVGSRGVPCPVRVHRWVDGQPPFGADPAFLRSAGASLHRIQQVGREWSCRPDGSLRWWDEEPLVVIERLESAGLLPDTAGSLRSVTGSVMELLDTAEKSGGDWVYSHCDHKPENSLRVGARPAVVDWDECGHILPRLEVVEAALRWAGGRTPDQGAFVAFLDGYRDAGGAIGGLTEADFAKWFAALLGWFAFQARRVLGDWPTETAEERDHAWASASWAWQGVKDTLLSVPQWKQWA